MASTLKARLSAMEELIGQPGATSDSSLQVRVVSLRAAVCGVSQVGKHALAPEISWLEKELEAGLAALDRIFQRVVDVSPGESRRSVSETLAMLERELNVLGNADDGLLKRVKHLDHAVSEAEERTTVLDQFTKGRAWVSGPLLPRLAALEKAFDTGKKRHDADCTVSMGKPFALVFRLARLEREAQALDAELCLLEKSVRGKEAGSVTALHQRIASLEVDIDGRSLPPALQNGLLSRTADVLLDVNGKRGSKGVDQRGPLLPRTERLEASVRATGHILGHRSQ
eukprot:TRINITY_DN880_c0_g4_i1.p1 TRINITY_DN880_c0_g4~~TRINITY_DN880_c0_g4_i1.p1  ORF type:complete len:284 (-),score=37.52 TRINITY_DN880_c0_g4_i1:108-959(-)